MEPADVALAYKELWRLERAFREMKSDLDLRPVFHQPFRITDTVANYQIIRMRMSVCQTLLISLLLEELTISLIFSGRFPIQRSMISATISGPAFWKYRVFTLLGGSSR